MKLPSSRWLIPGIVILGLAACAPGAQLTPTPTATLVPATGTVEPGPPLEPSATPAPSATFAPTATPTPAHGADLTLTHVQMLDDRNGWGLGWFTADKAPQVLRTADGGLTWHSVTPPQPSRQDTTPVAFFLDGAHAWVTFATQPAPSSIAAVVWRTQDGGKTWSNTPIDGSGLLMEFFYPGQIGFSDPLNGWFLVHLGVGMNHDYVALLTTADGGASWKFVVEPEKDNLWMSCQKNGVWFRDASHGFAVGTCNGVMAGLYLYSTADSGETWQELTLPAPAEMPAAYTNEYSMCEGTDLRFDSALAGWMLVRCTDMNTMKALRWLYRTSDGGQTWIPSLLPAPLGEIAFLDAQGWYISPPAPDQSAGTTIYHTANSGSTWQSITTVNWSGFPGFSSEKLGWVVAVSGEERALVHSSDGGIHWDLLVPVVAP
jgi:photosystem II stability/assembly factor-like uncharacterized protein